MEILRQLWRTPQPSSRSPARPGKSIEKVHRLYYVEQKINVSMRTIILSEMNGALQLTFSTFVHMRINAPFNVFRYFARVFRCYFRFSLFLYDPFDVSICVCTYILLRTWRKGPRLSRSRSLPLISQANAMNGNHE